MKKMLKFGKLKAEMNERGGAALFPLPMNLEFMGGGVFDGGLGRCARVGVWEFTGGSGGEGRNGRGRAGLG